MRLRGKSNDAGTRRNGETEIKDQKSEVGGRRSDDRLRIANQTITYNV